MVNRGSARRWLSRGAAIAAGLVLVLLVLFASFHSAPVRNFVLRRAVLVLADRFDLALGAGRLRYNLATGRVSLSNATLASTHAPHDPFLVADLIEVTVPPAALFGTLSVDRARLENARVALHWRADGTSNLPSAESSDDDTAPSAIPIGRIEIPRLTLVVTDERSGRSLSLPNISVDVRPDAGMVRLNERGRAASGNDATTVKTLGGGAAFDGRAIRLSRFSVVTDEADVTLDGQIALLVSDPHVDLRLLGTGDVSELARWATDEAVPDGRVAFSANVAGPLSSPEIVSRLRSDSLTYRRVNLSNIDADITVDGNRLETTRAELSVAEGRIVAAGSLTFDSSEANASVSWSDLNVEEVGRVLTDWRSLLPVGRASGEASFTGVPAKAGTWALDVSSRIVAARPSAGRLPIESDASVRVEAGQWRLEGTHVAAGARVRTSLRGGLDPSDLARSSLTGTIEARDTDVSRVIGSLQAAGLLDAAPPVADGRLDVVAAVSGSIAMPAVEMTVAGQGLTAFEVHGVALDAKANGDFERAMIEARVRQGGANSVTIDGTVWPNQARLDARVNGSLADLSTLVPGVPVTGTADVRVDASGPFQAIVARGSIKVSDARYEEAPLGPLEAQVAVDAGVARVDVLAPDFGAKAHADLRIGEPRTGVVDLQVHDAQIERLLRAAGLETDLSGAVSVTAHAEGSLDDWRHAVAAIEVSALDGRAEALAVRLREPARIWYDGSALDVLSVEASIGDTQLSIAGRYAVLDEAAAIAPGEALRGVLVGDLSHLLDAVRASGLAENVDVTGKGPVVVLTRVNGKGQRPLLSADIELGPAEIIPMDLPPLGRVQLRARVADGWAELVSGSGEWQQASVTVQGRAPLRLLGERVPDGLFASTDTAAGPASLDLRAVSVTSQALTPFLPPEAVAQIEGALDATVHLEAPALEWSSLNGEARLDRLDLAVAGVTVTQQESTRIAIERGIARVASWNWTGRGTSFVVQGEVRLPEQRAAVLAGGQIDLRLLTPLLAGADMAIGGSLTPRVSVSGPLDDLRVEGDVIVADGELRLREPGVIVTGLSATASLERDRGRITALNGQINGGSLTGAGEVAYGGTRGLAGSLTSTISEMGLEFPDGLRSELDADLRLELMSEDDDLTGTLSGTVTVVRSDYREPIAVVNQLLATLRTERLATAVSTEPAFADRLRLNVRVLTESDVIVDNNLARLQLGGDLRLIGTAAAPALSGRANLREGGELFIGGNRYTIESGTIDFASPVTIQPDLNVRALTRAGGKDIELTLTGTPETLSVDLRSTSHPELGQADIASLLLTGRELNEVSGAEAQIVGEQVISYLSGDVLGAASRVVGLDTLRLGGVDPTLRRRDSAEIASETDPTSRLTFGKSLGDLFEVTLSQSLREGGAQTWIVDYTPIRQVVLRYVSDDENLRSYQFRHDVTIGDPAGRPRQAASPAREAQRVASVQLAGELGGPDDRLRRVIDIEPGDEFDFSAWQRDRDRLERALHDERRLEARVSARRQDVPGGVAITYQIDAGPVTAIRFSGASLSGDTIAAIETAWTRAIFDDALVDDVERLVRRALAERGYLQPSVEAAMTTDERTKTLDIRVEAGERAVERRVLVDSEDETLAREIEEWTRRSSADDLAWRDPDAFQRALVGELRRRGHVSPDVDVAPPQADGPTAVVRVSVRAGPVVTIGAVRFSGVRGVAVDRLQDAAAIELGTSFDPNAVDGARERVARVMRGEGFADARVEANAEPEPDGRQVTVVFVIDEGPRQVLREIAVTGNRSIDRDVIVRALDLEVGDPLGADAWLQARSRLFDTALFRRVDVTAEPIARPVESPDGPRRGDAVAGEQPMRLLVTAEEWPALRVRYGVQVSEERPEEEVDGRDLTPGLSADITRRTLFGRAITVGAAAEYERRERLGRVFVNAPTLFGLPVESLLTVEGSREEIPEASVTSDRRGVSWEQRVQVGRPLRVSYGYRFDRDHTFSTRPSDDPLNPTFDVTVDVARLTGSLVFDTRNNPLDTTRGWLASSTIEYAPASLGSDIRFVRYLAQAYYFHPLRRAVLASAARLGLATALAGQLLIPSERFFAGGARTVRGVPESGLGPRDIFGDARGGGALVVFNQEIRVPLYRWFSGVGFVDVGNVFERPGTIDFAELVGSFGAGLRVATPFALLRADVARLWSPDAGQPTARWTFGIGHTF
jgi:outer membrane protein assembly factor BamA/autotransporter translocation and assembly factor TamB